MPDAGKSYTKIRQRQLNEISWEEKSLLSFPQEDSASGIKKTKLTPWRLDITLDSLSCIC